MISRPTRNRIRNTESRTTTQAARDSMYASRLQQVVRWLGTESNRRHADFQSAALPTELPSREPRNLTAPQRSFNPFAGHALPAAESHPHPASQTRCGV